MWRALITWIVGGDLVRAADIAVENGAKGGYTPHRKLLLASRLLGVREARSLVPPRLRGAGFGVLRAQ